MDFYFENDKKSRWLKVIFVHTEITTKYIFKTLTPPNTIEVKSLKKKW